MRISDWSSDVCSSDLAGAPDSDPAEPDGVDVLFADVLPVEVSFGLLPLMSATCFDPWFTDANSSPFFRCCVLCDPWFSVCHSCRSEEHMSELQSLMRISYAVFCLKKKNSEKKTEREIVRCVTTR